jgi:hypothetical protein
MARNVRPPSSRSSSGSFPGLLANALFWFLIAVLAPVEAIARTFPELASYAHWAPVLCYVLAFWSFIRALRVLKDLAASRTAALARARLGDAVQAERSVPGRKSKSDAPPPVRRTPTVQRMR